MAQNDPIKVYDARWEVNDFSLDEIRRFVESVLIYGRQIGADTITLSRDARIGSSLVMELVLEISLKSGFTVFLCTDPISTPQSYFISAWISRKHPHAMGLTITASHNPASYTGLKVTAPGVQAIGLDCGPSGGFTRVREIYHSTQTLQMRPNGKLNIVNLTEQYINYSIHAAGVVENGLKGVHVVLDSMSGSAGPEIYKALQRCGVEIEPLHLVPDGTFPMGSPDPTSKGKMTQAISLSDAKDGAIVIGTDGDGDRIVIGNSRGTLNAGFVSIPILKYGLTSLGNTKKTPVIYDPKVNPLALQEWFDLNIEPVLFRSGHSQIKNYMKQIEATVAVEESGHYYHKMHFEKLAVYCENSILTVLLFLRSLKENPNLLNQLWTRQDQLFSSGEMNFRLANDSTRDRAMEKVIGWFQGEKSQLTEVTDDGIDLQGTLVQKGIKIRNSKLSLSSEWYTAYLRIATNEKSVLRVFLSASSIDLGTRIETTIKEILHHFKAEEIE